MLKREVPTGPAVDLLREMLHTLLPGSVERRRVDEFLAGSPAHAPLPWVVKETNKEADLVDAKGRFIVASISPDNAALVGIAVNNFYQMRKTVEDHLGLLVDLDRERGGIFAVTPQAMSSLSRAIVSSVMPVPPRSRSRSTSRPR